jgi:hypothetical protein
MPVIPTHSDFETALLRAVDEVLYYVWDPIGINDEPLARSEYYDYVPRVFEILCSALPVDVAFVEIMVYLTNVEDNLICSRGNKHEAIDRLITFKIHLQERESEGYLIGPTGTVF